MLSSNHTKSIPTNTCQRDMELSITPQTARFSEEGFVTANLRVERTRRLIQIIAGNSNPLVALIRHCFVLTGPINEIDCFTFQTTKEDDELEFDLDISCLTYDNMPAKMPFLTKVFLEVPQKFEDETHVLYRMAEDVMLPLVEEASFKASSDTKIQTLLDKFCRKFPSLKQLTFFHYCGLWRPTMGEFQLELPQCFLARLNVDVTAARTESLLAGIITGNLPIKGFFVLEVEFMRNSKRHLYKVSFLDLSYTKLEPQDLNGLARGKDYLRVHITVNTLKHLDLLMSDSGIDPPKKDNYLEWGFDYQSFGTIVTISFDP